MCKYITTSFTVSKIAGFYLYRYFSRCLLSKIIFIKMQKSLRFLNLPSSVLYNPNNEVNCDFIFQPLTVERKLKMTAPVQNSGERGPFHKFLVKMSRNSSLYRFSAMGAWRTRRRVFRPQICWATQTVPTKRKTILQYTAITRAYVLWSCLKLEHL